MVGRADIGAALRSWIAGSALAALCMVATTDDAMAGPSGGKGPAAASAWECGDARIARMVPAAAPSAAAMTPALRVTVMAGIGDTDAAGRAAFAEATRRAVGESGLLAATRPGREVQLSVTIDRAVVAEYGARYLVLAVRYNLTQDGRPLWSGRIVTDGEEGWWLVEPCAQRVTSFETAARANLDVLIERVRRALRMAAPPAGDDRPRRGHLPLPHRRSALG